MNDACDRCDSPIDLADHRDGGRCFILWDGRRAWMCSECLSSLVTAWADDDGKKVTRDDRGVETERK